MHAHAVVLLDEYGQPLTGRLHAALLPLATRLQRQFPTLTDDCIITEVLEESGRRIAAREQRKGPLENLHAYAWVVVRRMALLRLRCGDWPIAGATVSGADSERALRGLPTEFATSEQIYHRILYKELRAQMTPTENRIALGKAAGLSMDEIARGCGTSRRTIANSWRRLKRRVLGQAQDFQPLAWKKPPPG